MAQLPKVRDRRGYALVGNVRTDPTLLWSWNHEALLVSESHYRLPSGSWSGGGPFFQFEEKLVHRAGTAVKATVWTQPADVLLQGVHPLADLTVPSYPRDYPSWTGEKLILQSRAPEGFWRANPLVPDQGSAFQFLVELKDLPQVPFKLLTPSAWGRHFYERLLDFRALGSEYLNIAFGWEPFVRDLQKFFELMKTVDKQIQRIRNENGQVLDREVTLVNEKTTEVLEDRVVPYAYWGVGGAGPFEIPGWYGDYNVHTYRNVLRLRTERIWWSGAFQYHIPDTASFLWETRKTAQLFGILPTPDAVWSVLPWSWMLDWFTNFGDVFSNISPINGLENLVLLRNYTMRTTEEEIHAYAISYHGGETQPGWMEWPDHSNGVSFSSFYRRVTKSRYEGNPYFPGMTFGDELNPRQEAILAALLSSGFRDPSKRASR